jgi:hypothetical protein
MHTSPLVTLTGCIIGRSRAYTVGGGGAGEYRNLKVHKRENFLDFDFEISTFS